jgi:hypothetical protein
MADFLVIIAIVVFVAAMLGLICGGDAPGAGTPIAHRPLCEKRRLVMPASTGSPIKTQALAAQACVPTSYPVDLAAHEKRAQQ